MKMQGISSRSCWFITLFNLSLSSTQSFKVRNPSERLGAGELSGTNGMNSLRSHSFFASVRWDTLWTDSAPPITAGLLQKDPAAGGRRWEDVGAAWDRLVADDEIPEDGIQWASDPDAPGYMHPHDTHHVAIGPMGEVRGVGLPPRSSSLGSSSSEGSPVKNLTNDMEAFSFRAPSPERNSPSHSDHERGRTQATTPVQGNGPPIDM